MILVTVHFTDQGIQWPLKDNYLVYAYDRAHHRLATLTGEYIRHLIEQDLATVVRHRTLQAALGAAIVDHVRKPLASANGLPTPEEQQERRAQRRARKPTSAAVHLPRNRAAEGI